MGEIGDVVCYGGGSGTDEGHLVVAGADEGYVVGAGAIGCVTILGGGRMRLQGKGKGAGYSLHSVILLCRLHILP